MKPITISYSKKDEEGAEYSGSVTMNFPEDVDEMASVYGGEVVFQKAKAQIVIDARRLCYEAETPEKAQELVDSFVPGVSRVRTISGMSKKAFLDLFSKLPKEEQEAMIAEAKARAEG